jgi:LPS export ABC transporter protein LptC
VRRDGPAKCRNHEDGIAGGGTLHSDRTPARNPDDRMNHKEIERWYRLRNAKRAAQVLVLVAIVLLVTGYVADRLVRPDGDVFPSSPAEGITIRNFSYSSPGAQPWELSASSATVSESLDRVALTDFQVMYPGGKGGKIYVTAKTGFLDRKSKNVGADGEVTIRFEDFVFTTDRLEYFHERRVAETTAEVRFEGGGSRMTGKGLTLSIEDERIVVEEDVQASLYNVKWVEPGQRLPM